MYRKSRNIIMQNLFPATLFSLSRLWVCVCAAVDCRIHFTWFLSAHPPFLRILLSGNEALRVEDRFQGKRKNEEVICYISLPIFFGFERLSEETKCAHKKTVKSRRLKVSSEISFLLVCATTKRRRKNGFWYKEVAQFSWFFFPSPSPSQYRSADIRALSRVKRNEKTHYNNP